MKAGGEPALFVGKELGLGIVDVDGDSARETLIDADAVVEGVASWVPVELAARGCVGLRNCDAVEAELDVAVILCERLGA